MKERLADYDFPIATLKKRWITDKNRLYWEKDIC
jgi:hypothetical protein